MLRVLTQLLVPVIFPPEKNEKRITSKGLTFLSDYFLSTPSERKKMTVPGIEIAVE